MCNLLEGWPLFKESIYNSIHVYLPHSDGDTVMDQGPGFHYVLSQSVNTVMLMLFREGKTL